MYQSKIANNFRENKATMDDIEANRTKIKDTVSEASKTLKENDRKYRNHLFDKTCQEVIKNRKEYRVQML
jgi:hypothetical protein